MNYIGIITTEYHVAYVYVASHGHTNGIVYRDNTWYYPWYQSWMQRVMRSTYSSCEIYYIPTMMFGMCLCIYYMYAPQTIHGCNT